VEKTAGGRAPLAVLGALVALTTTRISSSARHDRPHDLLAARRPAVGLAGPGHAGGRNPRGRLGEHDHCYARRPRQIYAVMKRPRAVRSANIRVPSIQPSPLPGHCPRIGATALLGLAANWPIAAALADGRPSLLLRFVYTIAAKRRFTVQSRDREAGGRCFLPFRFVGWAAVKAPVSASRRSSLYGQIRHGNDQEKKRV